MSTPLSSLSSLTMSPISERHVQAIWYDVALRPTELRTSRGTPVTVIDPGRWNLEAGPDFKDAVLLIGQERRRGDVEIHLHGPDWIAHGHSADPAYAHIVAHVTWFSPSGIPLSSGRLPTSCVQICLGDFVRTRSDFSPDEIDLTAYPYARLPASARPCENLYAHHLDHALSLIRAEGRRRLKLKARRLGTLFVRKGDRLQVFYEELMGALGYKQNAAAFRALAEAIPWYEIPHDAHDAITALSCAAQMSVMRRTPWKRANVRPCNAPHRRLRTLVCLLEQGLPALLRRLSACDLMTRDGQKRALGILRAARPLGLHRAAAVLANVLVPFALAEARMEDVPDWLFPEDVSAPVRLTAFRLLGRDHNPAHYAGNGLLIQGLIQIHRDFCLAVHPDCTTCPLVSQPS